MPLPATFEALIKEALQLDLYKKLVIQLNKDFLLANIHLDFDDNISPERLKRSLHECVYKLLQDQFADYLNLLYIIDVSERQIKALNGEDMVQLSEAVTFLILRREWQKVWFRHKS